MMTSEQTSYFMDDYFLANTPSFMLRKTLTNPRLQDVLQRSNDSQLQSVIERGSSEEATSEHVVGAYVALIAMLQRGSPKTIAALRSARHDNLRWFAALIAEWEATRQPTTTRDFYFAIKPTVTVEKAATGSSSIQSVAFEDVTS